MEIASAVHVYPRSGYIIHQGEPWLWKYSNKNARFDRMRDKYRQHGMMRSVGAIILVHVNNAPCILLFQRGRNAFIKLPGGRLRPGESEIKGLERKLTIQLGHHSHAIVPGWQIGECVAMWWRHDFNDTYYPCMNSQPKERKKMFLVHLPPLNYYQIPSNWHLLTVPLMALFQNPQPFGRVISSIPQQISRFPLIMMHGAWFLVDLRFVGIGLRLLFLAVLLTAYNFLRSNS